MLFIERLSELLKEKGVTANKMSKDLGLGNAAFSNWKARGTLPNGETLEKIADYFNVSTDYLLGRETPEVDRSAAMLQNANVLDELPPEALEDIDEFIMFTKQKYSK